MRDTQKRSPRYFCSCNREISVGNMLCRMVYRQKGVCVFLFYSFVLACTELFKVELFPKCKSPGRALPNQTSGDAAAHEELLCTDSLGEWSSSPSVPTVHALQHHASSRSPQSSVPVWNHRKHGMLHRLVLLIGTTWRGTE